MMFSQKIILKSTSNPSSKKASRWKGPGKCKATIARQYQYANEP